MPASSHWPRRFLSDSVALIAAILAQVEQLEDSSREFCLDPGLAALIFQGMACETGM
jgi:hypothetical protein